MAIIETPWFSCTDPPIRKGWYKVRYRPDSEVTLLRGYLHNEGGSMLRSAPVVKRYWNGRSWRWQSTPGADLSWASIDRKESEWCGIMEVPSSTY